MPSTANMESMIHSLLKTSQSLWESPSFSFGLNGKRICWVFTIARWTSIRSWRLTTNSKRMRSPSCWHTFRWLKPFTSFNGLRTNRINFKWVSGMALPSSLSLLWAHLSIGFGRRSKRLYKNNTSLQIFTRKFKEIAMSSICINWSRIQENSQKKHKSNWLQSNQKRSIIKIPYKRSWKTRLKII